MENCQLTQTTKHWGRGARASLSPSADDDEGFGDDEGLGPGDDDEGLGDDKRETELTFSGKSGVENASRKRSFVGRGFALSTARSFNNLLRILSR